MMSVSYKCFAYKRLKKQIREHCKIYPRLHKRQDLGKLPGMYKESQEQDREIPSDATSSFFCGGIMSAVAGFEGFVFNLLDEASDTILYKRKRCPGTCKDCRQLKYDHVVLQTESNQLLQTEEEIDKMKESSSLLFKRKYATLLKDVQTVYTEKFDNISFIDELLSVGKLYRDREQDKRNGDSDTNEDYPIEYFYSHSGKKTSTVKFENEVYLCVIMRLFYGLRCIMVHGSSVKTLKGALKDFPFCQSHCKKPKHDPDPCPDDCQEPTCKLAKISELNGHFNACIKELGKKKVMKTSRLYPKPQPLEKLTVNKDRIAAQNLAKKYFPELVNDEFGARNEFKDLTELPENYALYHLLRVYTNLKENERDMYITYRMLVRINLFYFVLAYRMKIAVGRILIHRYGLPDGIWGVPKGKTELIDKMRNFEKKYKNTAKNLHKIETDDHIIRNSRQCRTIHVCICATGIIIVFILTVLYCLSFALSFKKNELIF